jgi:hypothetical protein
MDSKQDPRQQGNTDEQRSMASPLSGKQLWQEPKLTFVEPKLTPHGKLEEVTAAFIRDGITPFTP